MKKVGRPRNVNAWRAAGILYGDLGTSKAYVIGLAFSIAGYASFWLIAAVSILTILIGINYAIICKHYPSGGGVYTSVRERSEVLSLLGAFFITADYIVTASLSALSACYYLGIPHPTLFAIGAIFLIGLLNFWGPRRIGSLAFVIAFLAVALLVTLSFFCMPHLKQGWENIQPLQEKFLPNWQAFVGVILTLSGIETIANLTGVMRLDPGSTLKKPSVKATAKRGIFSVVFEVAFFTTFYSFILCSINGLQVAEGTVFASNHEQIRDFVLRFIGKTYVGEALGQHMGIIFGYLIGIVFGLLLLSAVNTVMNGLISVLFKMSEDQELPTVFQKLNRYGVPIFPYIFAIFLPILMLVIFHDVAVLASLYAIGVVGAIAMNLGATGTDRTLAIPLRERFLLLISCLIMTACEITLFIDKPHARTYILTVVATGLILRGMSLERKKKKKSK